jgi:protein ImuB
MQFDTRSLWIYIHFGRLQLDLIEANGKLCTNKDAPRAVFNAKANQLCQVNNVAKKLGITLNMGLASASLSCSDLQLHEYDQDVESQHIINIANYLYLFTSDIVLAPPNALILRAQNMLTLYGGLQAYWQVIEQCLLKQKVHFVAASSYSVQGAKLLALSGSQYQAQYQSQHQAKRKLQHKTQQGLLQPSLLQHSLLQKFISDDRDTLQKYLIKCPLSLSDIDAKDIQKLARIGVKSYGDLLELPLADIANRVSRFSMAIINELQGKQAAKVKFYQPTPTYHDYLELLYELSNTDKLLPIIRISLDKLSEFLALRNAHTLAIKMRFFQRDHEPLPLDFSSIRPIYKSDDWLDIISLKLESVSFESPVYALSIDCARYEVAQVSNDDMFAKKTTHVEALTLLSRLQSKLGKTSVRQINYVEDFRPEYSTHSIALNDVALNDTSNTSIQIKASSILADRPGLLLPQPQPLNLQVEVIKGPERIQTGWWDDKPIKRDYYIGQSRDGQQVWIFKTPNKEWYLHGYFI